MAKSDQKKPIYKKWWFWILGLFVVVAIFNPTKDEEEKENKTPTQAEEKKEETEKEEVVSEDKEEVKEVTTTGLQGIFDKAGTNIFEEDYISTELNGEKDEDNKTVDDVYVQINLPENLTNKLIIKSFFDDTAELLKETKDVNYNTITVEALANFVDEYGKESEGTAIQLDLEKSEVDKIDFENFNSDNLANIATAFIIHPDLGYDEYKE